jgi:hypothetical protein
MVEIKAISPGVAGADHCLSQMSSDECAKALRVAKRKPRDKRDQLAPWRGALRHALSDSKVRATPAMPAL